MMDPNTMERRHRESAKILSDIENLKIAVDKLVHMHNGRHPPVQGQ